MFLFFFKQVIYICCHDLWASEGGFSLLKYQVRILADSWPNQFLCKFGVMQESPVFFA